MQLKHAVVTMVARDDLPDGGAGIIAETIRQVRLTSPGTSIEVLISDLNGARGGHSDRGRGAARDPEPQRRDGPATAARRPTPRPLGPQRGVLTTGRAAARRSASTRW